jgi:mRNA interferase HicA
MTGNEFVKKVKNVGDKEGVIVNLVRKRGKGSHSTLYYGEKRTIVPNLKSELKSGTLDSMLKQLGLTIDDLQ